MTLAAQFSASPIYRMPSACDRVFDALHASIVSLALPPGTALYPADIARQHDIAEISVHEAVLRLAGLDLVQRCGHDTPHVTWISEARVLEAAFVRTALELACLEDTIPKITDAEIAELQGVIERQEAAVGDALLFHQLDDELHHRMCDMAGRGDIWRVIRHQKAHMDRVRFLSLAFGTGSALDDHRAIVAALAARDGTAARRTLKEHLLRIHEALPRVRAEYARFFSDEQG